MARVLPYPWSLLAPRGDIGTSFSLEDCETAEPLNPESLTFFTRAEDVRRFVRGMGGRSIELLLVGPDTDWV